MIKLLKLLNFRHVKSHLLLHFSETPDLRRLLKLKTHNLYGKIYMKMLHFQEKNQIVVRSHCDLTVHKCLVDFRSNYVFSTRLLKAPHVSQVQKISQDF